MLSWEQALTTGHPAIDSGHRQLVSSIDALCLLLDRDTISPIEATKRIRAVAAAMKRHMQEEERLLSSLGFDGVQAHSLSHELTLDAFERLSQSLLNRARNQRQLREACAELHRFLGRTVLVHLRAEHEEFSRLRS